MKKLLLLLAVASQFTLLAQRNCSTMDVLHMQQKEDPFLNEKMDQIETFTQNFIQNKTEAVTGVVTIPVVFHVVYNRRVSAQNVSLSQLQSQIAVLNQDFRRLNADANNTWNQADDVEIEFCLASVDPNGNPTNGVTRKSTKKNSFGTNNSVKYSSQGGTNAWPASSYLNIWVCNIGGGILGYAQFPGGAASSDGVVLDYRYIGTTGTATYPFNLGRTATHEVGHWLNLRHIWGDGPCSVDDFVGDTPESDNPNYGCATGHVSCSTTDMIENYMDYSDDACMNLFTTGQKSRMRALFEPGGFRAALLNSNGCGGGGPTGPTCFDGIQNGDETGIDCGGSVCPPCQNPGTCADPTGLSAQSRKGGREANLSWNASAGALSYEVGLRQAGASAYATATTTSTSITATGLSRNSSYDWYVIANCAGGATSNQVNASFTARLATEKDVVSELTVFPNPATSWVNISFKSETQNHCTIAIMDVAGRVVLKTEKDVNAGTHELEMPLANFAAGIYLMHIQIGNYVQQQKLVIE